MVVFVATEVGVEVGEALLAAWAWAVEAEPGPELSGEGTGSLPVQ